MTTIDKSRQTSGVPLFHRVTVGGAGLSSQLTLPSATRDVTVTAVGAAARLYLSLADEAAGTGYFEVPSGVSVSLPIRTPALVAQGQGAGTITIITTHDALAPADAAGIDYVAA